MTVEELRRELEIISSDLTRSGFENIDSAIVEKMGKFAAVAGELGMNEGKRLIGNLFGVMKGIQEGKSKISSANLRLTALSFYVKKLSDCEHTEEL